ncbi:hypothetical protein PATA110616_18490 [Paenibacillus tarimensis]
MWIAAMWGAISGSAVRMGAILALYLNMPKRLIGFIMAFGTGVLIGAATYELGEATVCFFRPCESCILAG